MQPRWERIATKEVISYMVTKPEIRNRYPRKIELDESLGTPGPSFLRVRPGGATFPKTIYSFCIATSLNRQSWTSG